MSTHEGPFWRDTTAVNRFCKVCCFTCECIHSSPKKNKQAETREGKRDQKHEPVFLSKSSAQIVAKSRGETNSRFGDLYLM